MNKFNIKKSDFDYWGQWKQPLLSTWLWLEWHKTNSLKELNTKKLVFHPYTYLDGHFWLYVNDRPSIWKTIEEMLNEEKIEAYATLFDATFQKYEKEYLDVLSQDSTDPYLYIQKLFAASENMASIWSWVLFISEKLEKLVVEHKIVNSEQDLMEKIHSNSRMTWLEKQSIEINEFAEMARSLNLNQISLSILEQHEGLKQKVEAHVKEFSWFGTHHWMGNGYTSDECIQQINEAIKNPKVVHVRKSLTAFEHPALTLIALGVYWRTHSAEVTAKVAYESRSVLERIGNMAGITYDELIYLSAPEILTITKDSDSEVLKAEIMERQKGYGCMVGDEIQIVTGSTLKTLLSEMLADSDETITEFKGNVASKGGVVKGIARVIISPEDFNKLQEGEILVAPETTPDYVPLMKKALAILTDVGGITSHAAIVSRELRKPCIIGTKVATKVLKDGMEIEVDTNTGIVKIL